MGQDGLLSHDILLLIFFNNVFFLEYFHRVNMLVLLVPDQDHLGVGALADD